MIEAACLTGTSLIQDNPLPPRCAEVAKLADALDSGSSARKGVRVQIPPSAPHETSMPFTFLPFRRFSVQCAVSDLPTRPGETFSLTDALPNEQCIEIPDAVVLWSRGQEFAIEDLAIKPHTRARFQHDINRLIQEAAETVHE